MQMYLITLVPTLHALLQEGCVSLFSPGIYNNTIMKMQGELKLGRTETSLSRCDLFSLFRI